MAEIASSGERVREGNAALARGEWAEAREIFEQELETRDVDALEGLSWAAWWVEDVPTCLEARERAYRLSRREGDMRRAAMLALWVADDYLDPPRRACDRQRLVPARGPHPRRARDLPRARLARRAPGLRGHRRRRSGKGEGTRVRARELGRRL